MLSTEYKELRAQHDLLKKWQRQAASYAACWGRDGSRKTRQKHEARLAEAERDLPGIEARLINAWGNQ